MTIREDSRMTEQSQMPKTMKAVILEEKGQPLQLKTVVTPRPCPGGIVVKILYTWVDANILAILSGKVPSFVFSVPMIPGTRAIGRVASPGSDTTSFRLGDLVLLEPNVRARDNPDVRFLWGGYGGGTLASQTLAADNWRHGCMAEYALAPLENCWSLNEEVLCGQLGYSLVDFLQLTIAAVPCGGLRAINLQPGETILIAPATGRFSGSAVEVAVAMGAKVIAAGRQKAVLDALRAAFPRVVTLQLRGTEKDIEAVAALGPVDAYLDFSPPGASGAAHIQSCFGAVRPHGRLALMGIMKDDIPIPYMTAMWKCLTIRGQYMYEPDDMKYLIRLAESGLLKLGKDAAQKIALEFPVEKFNEAFDTAARDANALQSTVLIM